MAQLTEHRREQEEMHREVAEMYKRRTGYRFSEEFQQERNDILVSMAPAGRELRAVDLGCGTGILLHHLAHRYRRVVGLDLSREMLSGYSASALVGRSLGDGVTDGANDGSSEDPSGETGSVGLLCGDMTALPIADASFDVIYCRSALHHMDDEVAVLSEMCRILKADGSLVVGEPANDNPVFRLARWWVRRRPSFGKIHTIDRAYTRAQLRDLFDRAGLKVTREYRFGFIAYTFCDNPELVPVLKWLPAGLALGVARALRVVDRVCARIPLVRSLSWYTMLEVSRK